VNTHLTLMRVLNALDRPQEAQKALEKAIVCAKTVEPEFQKRRAENLEQRLEELRNKPKE